MKYVRTKDGRIYQVYDKVFEYKEDKRYQLVDSRFEISLNDIVKEADTIEELIMPGDLVRYDVLYMSWIEKDRGDKVRGIDMHLIPRKSVDMLWIPTGIDTECYPNFKLVASKEDKEGKLVLL